MDLKPASEHSLRKRNRGERGIALFMVLAAISILTVLVSEFVYVGQVNSRMAFDGIDQLKAHYIAKSGYKLSLLRLKAYKQVKDFATSQGLQAFLPPAMLQQIWSFPFAYPIPKSLPGLTMTQKDAIDQFQKASSIDGSYTAIIQSESSRFNLNSLVIRTQTATTPTPQPAEASPTPVGTPTTFTAEDARNSFIELIQSIFQNKVKSDEDFAEEYRDTNVNELAEAMIAWADPTYEPQNLRVDRDYPWKKAPYYSISELHLIPGMDDTLYNLFAPSFTVSPTTGININTIEKPMLHALFPQMTEEELELFFQDRDPSATGGGKPFSDENAFYQWIKDKVAAIRGSEDEMKRIKESFQKRGIKFVTEETEFVIRVSANVRQASQTLEAWVTLGNGGGGATSSSSSSSTPTPTPQPSPTPEGGGASSGIPSTSPTPTSGIQVRFMRFL